MSKTSKSRAYIAIFFAVLVLPILACSAFNMNTNTAYWTCQTATPEPTRRFPIGTATPATPITSTATYEAPVIYDYTTPVPTETPQYQVEYFFLDQLVHIGGVGVRLVGLDSGPTEQEGVTLYRWHFEVTNMTGEDELVIPLPMIAAIREVNVDGARKVGRWHQDTDSINLEEHTYNDRESRLVTILIEAPTGSVNELLVSGNWQGQMEGGTPIYFVNEVYNDQDAKFCGYQSARWEDGKPPPPPTPHIIGFSGAGGGLISGSGVCGEPIDGIRITRGFGCAEGWTGVKGHGCSGSTPWFHTGMDIAAVTGTDVFAPIAGAVTVEDLGDKSYGLHVRVSNGSETHLLAHLSEIHVVTGDQVMAGARVAESGNSGASTGPHLHWEVRMRGEWTDPALWEGCTQQSTGPSASDDGGSS